MVFSLTLLLLAESNLLVTTTPAKTILPQNKTETKNRTQTADVYDYLHKAAVGLSACMVSNGLIPSDHQLFYNQYSSPSNFSVGERSLAFNSDLKVDADTPITANTTTFNNNTNTEMTYDTPSFTYSATDTLTTVTTRTIDNGLNITAQVPLPAGSVSVALSAHFNFSTSNSQTTSETFAWTVPSQHVSVKPHQKIRVTWILNKMKAKGTVNLRDRFSAYLPYGITNTGPSSWVIDTMGLGEVVGNRHLISDNYWNAYTNDSIEKWHKVDNQTADYDIADANYSANYGTEMNLKVDDITSVNKEIKEIANHPIINVTRKPIQK